MNYLDLFKVRSNAQQIRQKIAEFEKETNVVFPPYFRVFIENYDSLYNIGEELGIFYDNRFQRKRNMIFTYYSNDRDNILFQNLFNLDEIIPNMKAVYPKDHEIWQQDFIAFGECAFQIYLLVGVGEHNKDKIYAEAATEKVKLRFLCDNIFDFFRDYIVEVDESCLPAGKTANDLYKNWGEDFWRVREE
ncbi:SMI1/KNR4 family protein [Flectobacillus sp. BAB-3569]|uniref:SMI1/KNR4 family protein n=1 Tax=Flectobacillus sp. BAB-3569 TaxID=1509483 RepID=UPI000BA410DD|nr:SMI1/KNR4 family protein [Flectobacillus sp. BAB-3569]PAC26728.1 hypothetical protein BWI92_25070 [Flectobacillus sp. BAB-3569]